MLGLGKTSLEWAERKEEHKGRLVRENSLVLRRI